MSVLESGCEIERCPRPSVSGIFAIGVRDRSGVHWEVVGLRRSRSERHGKRDGGRSIEGDYSVPRFEGRLDLASWDCWESGFDVFERLKELLEAIVAQFVGLRLGVFSEWRRSKIDRWNCLRTSEMVVELVFSLCSWICEDVRWRTRGSLRSLKDEGENAWWR